MIGKELITIVVPTYNAEQFLRENIESIINQSYRNLEIIYVCDGCTDGTIAILNEYAITDERLIVKVEPINQGAAMSRNIGMAMATGDWIIFLDADDLFDNKMIEEMLSAATEAQADIAGCYLEYFDDVPNENVHINNEMRKQYCKNYPVIETQRELGHIMQVIDYGPCTKLVHKSIYKKDEVFFQSIPNTNDLYYSISVVINSTRIVYVDKVLLHYRSNKNRNTLSTDRNLKKSYILEAFDLIFKYIKDNECLLKSYYNEIMVNIDSYKEYEVYDSFFECLKDTYLCKWEMYKQNIWKKLSCVNRCYYNNLLCGDKKKEKQEIVMWAKVEFVREMSEKGCSIWGVGVMGSNLLKEIADTPIKIQHVFDSEPNKWGKMVEGYLIENFEDIQTDNIIVTTSRYYNEIKKQIGNRAKNVYDLEKQVWLIPEEGDN